MLHVKQQVNSSRSIPAAAHAHGLAHARYQRLQALIGCLPRGVDRDVGLGVEGCAAVEDAPQIVHCLLAVGHGPHIPLRHHAPHMLLGGGAQPDGGAMRQQLLEGGRVRDDAPGRRDDDLAVDLQRFFQRPARDSIAWLSSMKGISSARASSGPSVDLPAPRRPTKAMRLCLAGSSAPLSSACSARRARRNCGSLRCSSSSRISSHSGERVVKSPCNSASEQCSAPATCCNTRIDALPVPYSRFARWRSEMPAAKETALRVRPRCARSLRTRSPRATSRGFLASSVGAAAWGDALVAKPAPASCRSFIPILMCLMRALYCLTPHQAPLIVP